MGGKHNVPHQYEDAFRRAKQTFLHQRIFDPKERQVLYRNAITEDMIGLDLDYLGPEREGDSMLDACEVRYINR